MSDFPTDPKGEFIMWGTLAIDPSTPPKGRSYLYKRPGGEWYIKNDKGEVFPAPDIITLDRQ